MANSYTVNYIPTFYLSTGLPAASYYMKAYEAGAVSAAVTTYSSASDSTGATKYQLNSLGQPASGGTAFAPHYRQSVDVWIFPTSAEADANDTTNAIQVIDASVTQTQNTVTNITALKALAGQSDGDVAVMLGHTTAGDGGGGLFRWDSTDTTADDGGYYIQPTAGGTGRWIRDVQEGRFNVRWWGALPSASTNVSTETNTAITTVNTLGGGDIWLPPSTNNYYYTSSITAALKVNILGAGQASKLTFADCDGIDMADLEISWGVLKIEDVYLSGTGGTTRVGIIHDGDLSATPEFYGLEINRVLIDNFNLGIHLRSVRNFLISHCWMQDINSAIKLDGQTITGTIEANECVVNNGNGSGTSYGILCDVFNYTTSGGVVKPEGITIKNNDLYNFEYCVDLNNVIAATVRDNQTLSRINGIKFTTVSANITIDGNYVQMNGTASTKGIAGTGLASEPAGVAVNVTNNHVICTGTSACNGIQLNESGNQNQGYINICGNSITGTDNYDIALFNVGNVNVIGNMCFSANTNSIKINGVLSGKLVTVDRNYCVGNINQTVGSTLGQIIMGANGGSFSTFIRGETVITAPGTSATTSFASLTGSDADSGTTTGTTANKLVDSGQNFTSTVTAGMIVTNTTDSTLAYVTAVDSDTTLSLSADIMTSGEAYTIRAANIPRIDTKTNTGFNIRAIASTGTDLTVKQALVTARADGLGVDVSLEATTAGTVTIPWEVRVVQSYT